ncbi:formyltransferase family protein [uncultured Alsobacter sp.]|uniref:methionyl-tRNA formyltransferase n=1 Tax=uncultured Alsobacter sp. TaxID=1748258 RepID=UPI0025D0ABF8|nr:formyltransferase family protein [uncultured Alsobacter sp.]
MRIAILGRTRWLLEAAAALADAGHRIVFVATAKAAPEYGVDARDFAALASRHAAVFLDDPAINNPETVDVLRASGAEVGVSINWPTLIRQTTCEALPHGILNSHSGDLPRYRGNACPNWAIINGEERVGLCVHRMDPVELDAGPVFARSFLPLADDTYIADVYAWMATEVPALFLAAVSNLQRPGFVPEDQAALGVRPLRCHPRRSEDGRIDWSAPASHVLRLVRASSRPFRGAFAFLDGETEVTIWRARPAALDHDVLAVPGQIMGRGPHQGVLVACGSGVIEIDEADMRGGGRLPSANRFRLTPWPGGSPRVV